LAAASYIGQVSNDTSSAFYHNAINVDRYNLFALGGMVGYNFGPVSVNVWATKDVIATASGGPSGPDKATIPKGYKVFANINFRFKKSVSSTSAFPEYPRDARGNALTRSTALPLCPYRLDGVVRGLFR
jgi:hypothetical protein